MDSFLKADIFFFITSVAVAVLAIAGIIVAYYAVRAFRSVELLAEKVRAQLNEFEDGVGSLRRNIAGHVRFAVRLAEFAASTLMRPRYDESEREFRRDRR